MIAMHFIRSHRFQILKVKTLTGLAQGLVFEKNTSV